MSTSVWMVLSYPTMDMWSLRILALLMTLLFSVILITLHLLVLLILEETGGHQMGLECLVLMSQES